MRTPHNVGKPIGERRSYFPKYRKNEIDPVPGGAAGEITKLPHYVTLR